MEEGQLFPVKLICSVIHVFGCDICPVRATKTESKDYTVCDCKTVKGNE